MNIQEFFDVSVSREPRKGHICLPNVPSDLSLLAFGIPPAREAESAGGMPKVPKGQGLGRLVCSAFYGLLSLGVPFAIAWKALGKAHISGRGPSIGPPRGILVAPFLIELPNLFQYFSVSVGADRPMMRK